MNKILLAFIFTMFQLIPLNARWHNHFGGGFGFGFGGPMYSSPWASRWPYWNGYYYPGYGYLPGYAPIVINQTTDVYRTEHKTNPAELYKAISNGNLDDVKALATKINLNISSDGRRGKTPLIWAVEHQQVAIVEFLLSQKVSINSQDKEKNTALHYATKNNDDICIKLLCNHGALIDIHNRDKKTPLFIATQNKFAQGIAILLAHGANPDLQCTRRKTPRIIAQDDQDLIKLFTTKTNRIQNSYEPEQNKRNARHPVPRIPVERS